MRSDSHLYPPDYESTFDSLGRSTMKLTRQAALQRTSLHKTAPTTKPTLNSARD
jgi:hypothetical protein